jgi:surface protein
MKLNIVVILLLAAINSTTAVRCRRWLEKCVLNSDCCNNRRCMSWGRCSLLHRGQSTGYKCFENGNELSTSVIAYREGNEAQKKRVKGIYGDTIGAWCVDKVAEFAILFDETYNAAGFNEDISRWNTSSATDMNGMFSSQTSFNQDLSRWDVSKVKDMSYMFYNASSFNKTLSTWDVSKVTNFGAMFHKATIFNQDISSWNLSSVTYLEAMFLNATAFNTDLCQWRSKINSSIDVENMFKDTKCPNKNDPLFESNMIRNMCNDCA